MISKRNNLILSKINQKLRKPDHFRVRFEGGLGSQLLAFIELRNKERLFGDKVKVDVRYFEKNEEWIDSTGLKHYSWKLDKFGVNLSEVKRRPQVSRLSWKRSPSLIEHSKFVIMKSLFETNGIKTELSLNDYGRTKFEKSFLNGAKLSDYGVVHIRRGDFLKVSTKVVHFDEVLTLLTQLISFLPKLVILISDGLISEFEQQQIDLFARGKINFIVLDSKTGNNFNDYELHDLMRFASFLVTSNSTYSFSAAILSQADNALLFIPSNFYAEFGLRVDDKFLAHSSYSLLQRKQLH